MGKTSIEWTDVVWNPTRGCLRVSVGCGNCYAERMAYRFSKLGEPYSGLVQPTSDGPRWTGIIHLMHESLEQPFHWRKPRNIFVDSMSDLFHDAVPDGFIIRVFNVIRRCLTERPGHTFQILTKRPKRMQDFCSRLRFDGNGEGRMWLSDVQATNGFAKPGDGYALVRSLTNLWLGVSVEDQCSADERIPYLLDTPAAVRFISCEPLLGPIDLTHINIGILDPNEKDRFECNALVGGGQDTTTPWCIDWIIVGGETGAKVKVRPCNLEWIRSIIKQCKSAQVPCFVKQLGTAANLRNRKGAEILEWPEDLRVRETPHCLDSR